MDGSLRIGLGALFGGIGGVCVVLGAKRRDVFVVLQGLVSVAFGLGALLWMYKLNTVFSAMAVLVGSQYMIDGIRTRSAATIVASAACVAAGAGGLAHLYSWEKLLGALMTAQGVWGLVRARGTRRPGDIVFYGGCGAMGIGLLTWFFPLIFVASLAFVANVFLVKLPPFGGPHTPEPDAENQRT